MTVKIEMDMPKSCSKCQFCILKDFGSNEHTHKFRNVCFLTKDELLDSLRERYTNCPLQEVKEEKGGNMNKDKFFIIRFDKGIQQAIETTIYPDQLLNKKQALKTILED